MAIKPGPLNCKSTVCGNEERVSNASRATGHPVASGLCVFGGRAPAWDEPHWASTGQEGGRRSPGQQGRSKHLSYQQFLPAVWTPVLREVVRHGGVEK